MSSSEHNYIGIDLGGTQVRVGAVRGGQLGEIASARVNREAPVAETLEQIDGLLGEVGLEGIQGIGVGVPGLVDVAQGMVYDLQNIPAWVKVPLKSLMEEKYGLPVQINNDANCFVLGEKQFGKGRGYQTIVGLIIGTGFGSGVVVGGRLHQGKNCGAGEFGMIGYLDSHYEMYAAGQFFPRRAGQTGEELYAKALAGDPQALEIFSEFGGHVGNGIKTILYAYDPEIIIIGGTVRTAFDYFKAAMWSAIGSFAFPESVKNLKIELSELDNIAILGASTLCYSEV